jgi:hypothetical protein
MFDTSSTHTQLPVYLLHEAQGAFPFKMRSFLNFATPLWPARLAAAAL